MGTGAIEGLLELYSKLPVPYEGFLGAICGACGTIEVVSEGIFWASGII